MKSRMSSRICKETLRDASRSAWAACLCPSPKSPVKTRAFFKTAPSFARAIPFGCFRFRPEEVLRRTLSASVFNHTGFSQKFARASGIGFQTEQAREPDFCSGKSVFCIVFSRFRLDDDVEDRKRFPIAKEGELDWYAGELSFWLRRSRFPVSVSSLVRRTQPAEVRTRCAIWNG